jgi:hypothetical protein
MVWMDWRLRMERLVWTERAERVLRNLGAVRMERLVGVDRSVGLEWFQRSERH